MNLRNLRNMDKEELLNMIGLETRRSATDWILPSIGLFTLGAAIGAGIGMLFAPRPGSELRSQLRSRAESFANESLGQGQSSNMTGINAGSSADRPMRTM
jgi:hypothetical protein